MNARGDAFQETTPAAGTAGAAALPGGTALLGAGAVIVWNDVAEEGRAAFYAWHDKEHIPERLAIPGFRRGRRFVCADHSPEWLTMYEADDLTVVTSPAYLARLNAPTPATVETLRHFRNTSRAVCRLVASTGSSTGGHLLAMRLDVPLEQGAALIACIAGKVFAAAIHVTGVLACHLFVSDQAASHVNTAESSTRTFDVPSWVLLAETSTPDAAEAVQRLVDAADLARLHAVVRSDAAVYALEIARLAQPADVASPASATERKA